MKALQRGVSGSQFTTGCGLATAVGWVVGCLGVWDGSPSKSTFACVHQVSRYKGDHLHVHVLCDSFRLAFVHAPRNLFEVPVDKMERI